MYRHNRAIEKETTATESDAARNATPEIPEPNAATEPEAQDAQTQGVLKMSNTDFINVAPGENPHPVSFTIGSILLIIADIALARILFQGYVPTTAFSLPNNFGTVTPDDLVPLGAFLTYCLQYGMYRWRPAGLWGGILDFLISIVPALIIGAAILSWMGLFDFDKVNTPVATRSHFAALVVFWFGFFAILDIVLHTLKLTPRTTATARPGSVLEAEPYIGSATASYPNGFVVAPLKDDLELTYIPKRNIKVVAA